MGRYDYKNFHFVFSLFNLEKMSSACKVILVALLKHSTRYGPWSGFPYNLTNPALSDSNILGIDMVFFLTTQMSSNSEQTNLPNFSITKNVVFLFLA